GRILGAVLFTTVATLGVAALALLGPLEHSLRTAELTTLRGEVGSAKYTGAKSFSPTISPFRASRPELVGQAGIPRGKESSRGGAAISEAAAPGQSSCRHLRTADAQEACLQRQGEI